LKSGKNSEECVPSYPCLFCISILNLETSKESKTELLERPNWQFEVLIFKANVFIANHFHVFQLAAGHSDALLYHTLQLEADSYHALQLAVDYSYIF
jgi:hypothetical protein